MEITYDPAKNERNVALRGLSFERAAEIDFATAQSMRDLRKAYPESRWILLGKLDGRLHVLIYTPTADGIRVISLRRANKREVKQYGAAEKG